MKEVCFKTSKGEFIAVEIPDSQRYDLSRMAIRNDFYRIVRKLSGVTEKEASKVVDDRVVFKTNLIKDVVITFTDYHNLNRVCATAKESLHSLLRSKGIDVNNGNWYLFKKI